jgi:protease I
VPERLASHNNRPCRTRPSLDDCATGTYREVAGTRKGADKHLPAVERRECGMPPLEGKTIAILVSNYGVEQAELAEPKRAITDAGARAVIVGVENSDVQTLIGDKEPGDTFAVDVTTNQANAADYDALIIPGGTINADKLRTDAHAVDLVRAFADSKKPVAAICHGPWALVEADVVRGKNLTSYPSLRTDIRNAGGTWRDEQVVICHANDWTLITSRTPKDLDAFNPAIVEEFAREEATL